MKAPPEWMGERLIMAAVGIFLPAPGSVPVSNAAATEPDFVRSKARGEKFGYSK